MAGEGLPVYGKGLNVRDWLFVEDHARALTRVFEAKQKFIKSIVSKDKKLQWDYDPRKQQFTGPMVMPEGIEKTITPQEMTDLITFLLKIQD